MNIIKGTDATLNVNFTEDNEPVNITGYTLFFTIKKECDINKDDTYALIKKDITEHTDAEQGKSQIILTNEDTNIPAGNYYWDIRLKKEGVITQTKRDRIEITEGITKRK